MRCETTPGLPIQRARDIPNESGNGVALTHILVYLELVGAPEQNKFGPRKCNPTVALLEHNGILKNGNDNLDGN